MKKLTVLSVAAVLAVLGATAPQISQAQSAPFGPGWYFYSICGLVGSAASQCWFGQFAMFGAYSSAEACAQTINLMSGTAFLSWPYAPSTCFYQQ